MPSSATAAQMNQTVRHHCGGIIKSNKLFLNPLSSDECLGKEDAAGCPSNQLEKVLLVKRQRLSCSQVDLVVRLHEGPAVKGLVIALGKINKIQAAAHHLGSILLSYCGRLCSEATSLQQLSMGRRCWECRKAAINPPWLLASKCILLLDDDGVDISQEQRGGC